MNELKSVEKFSDPMAARLAEAKLKDNGIEAAIFGESSSFPSVNYDGPIELKVNEADYERSLSILAASDKAE